MEGISVIIANYNSKETLDECLSHLEELRKAKEIQEIIVVDNASPDGAAAMVAKKHPTVTLIALTKNSGISKSYNIAAAKSKCAWLLFLGSDAFPEKGMLPNMLAYVSKNPKIGCVTAQLKMRDGSLDMDAHRGFPTPWVAITHFLQLEKVFPRTKLFDGYFLGYKPLATPHEIDMGISHFLLVSKEHFDEMHGFDEDFFVFGEDVDFYYRIKQAGYQNWYLPQFTAIHYKGVSVGLRKESKDISKASVETKLRMSQASTNAMKLFYKKHYSQKYPRILTGMVLLAISLMAQIRMQKIKRGR